MQHNGLWQANIEARFDSKLWGIYLSYWSIIFLILKVGVMLIASNPKDFKMIKMVFKSLYHDIYLGHDKCSKKLSLLNWRNTWKKKNIQSETYFLKPPLFQFDYSTVLISPTLHNSFSKSSLWHRYKQKKKKKHKLYKMCHVTLETRYLSW